VQMQKAKQKEIPDLKPDKEPARLRP
jgi:hypothetical protein